MGWLDWIIGKNADNKYIVKKSQKNPAADLEDAATDLATTQQTISNQTKPIRKVAQAIK